jgi:hypothetical protein
MAFFLKKTGLYSSEWGVFSWLVEGASVDAVAIKPNSTKRLA